MSIFAEPVPASLLSSGDDDITAGPDFIAEAGRSPPRTWPRSSGSQGLEKNIDSEDQQPGEHAGQCEVEHARVAHLAPESEAPARLAVPGRRGRELSPAIDAGKAPSPRSRRRRTKVSSVSWGPTMGILPRGHVRRAARAWPRQQVAQVEEEHGPDTIASGGRWRGDQQRRSPRTGRARVQHERHRITSA